MKDYQQRHVERYNQRIKDLEAKRDRYIERTMKFNNDFDLRLTAMTAAREQIKVHESANAMLNVRGKCAILYFDPDKKKYRYHRYDYFSHSEGNWLSVNARLVRKLCTYLNESLMKEIEE